MSDRPALLAELVDYAGLFPPASSTMESAVREYALQRRSPQAWMLAAFVVPAARLEEFARAAGPWRAREGGRPWPLSVLLGPEPLDELADLAVFGSEHAWIGEVVAVEFRPSEPARIGAVAARVPRTVQVFCELAWNAELGPWSTALRAYGAWAKIRTGGVIADLLPPVAAVARFLRGCAAAGVGLKFTAGLHHPVRAAHPLSYAPDAPVATMHGFLNVFVAAALIARGGASDTTVEEVLGEEDPAAFRFGSDGSVCWRDQVVTDTEFRSARASFARSFGSCSFAEPVQDLLSLGHLPGPVPGTP